MGKAHTHILAADVAEQPSFACYVTSWLKPGDDSAEQVGAALRAAGLPDEAAAVAVDLHEILGARRPDTLFLSMRLKAGAAEAAVKLDYSSVRLGTLMEIMAERAWDNAIGAVIEWGRLLGTFEASYAGFIYNHDGLADIRAYFTRYGSI